MNLELDRSQWKRVRFDDIALSVTDRVDDPTAAGVDRYVGLEHLDPGTMTVERWGSPDEVSAQKLRFKPGDVIFGRRRAYQKKVARADFEGICSAHALVLRAKPNHVLPDFLPVFLSSDYFLIRAISISVGSLSPTINWRDLRVEEFDLPPLDQQQRIADLLWAVERHRIDLTEKQSAVVNAEAFIADERIWSARFELKSIADVLTSCKYGTSERCSYDAPPDATPVLRIPNVMDGSVDLVDLKYLPDQRPEGDPTSVEAGDLLIVRTNGNPSYVTRGALVPRLDRQFFFASYLLRLRSDPSALVPEYLARLWETPSFKRQLAPSIRSSAGNYNISASAILGQRIPTPSLSVQKSIAAELSEWASTVKSISNESVAISKLGASVRQQVFRSAV